MVYKKIIAEPQRVVPSVVLCSLTRRGVTVTDSAAGAAVGMNVNELTSVMSESVGEIVQALPSSGTSGFGKTHPQPAQRIAEAQKTVASHKVADTASVRTARFASAAR